ncbi:MAG: hypothetical protein RJA76_866 [Bacteroidota bacterium]|jgi:UDP-N-acetylglucosamine diphosphorylase/glucosamine-1-phosphate N-acetyltransferase
MQAIIELFDDPIILQQLRPLTDHKSLGDLLIGTSTISEKWEKITQSIELKVKLPLKILGSTLPTLPLIDALKNLNEDQSLYLDQQLIAQFENNLSKSILQLTNLDIIQFPEDLLTYQKVYLPLEIKPSILDVDKLSNFGNIILSPENCSIHPSASLKGTIIDASNGPVYIGENTQLQIGTLIQGPVAILNGSVTNIGAKIRPFTTIGKNCKVGGEISHSILHDYTNKSHEGYLGNSVIGSFCNFGALSNSSNVKNDLKEIQLYDYVNTNYRQTKSHSIGLITGDYITTGIGSQFNTGTVLGSHSNITCHQFPNRYIPSFSWGQYPAFEKYKLEKAISNAEKWARSKKQQLSEDTINRIKEIWKEL